MDITELLGFSVKQGASDLHITAGMPPLIRVDGDIRRINVPEMDHKEVHSLIYEIMNDKQRKDYEEFSGNRLLIRSTESCSISCQRFHAEPRLRSSLSYYSLKSSNDGTAWHGGGF